MPAGSAAELFLDRLFYQLYIIYGDSIITLHPEKLASKKFGYSACDR